MYDRNKIISKITIRFWHGKKQTTPFSGDPTYDGVLAWLKQGLAGHNVHHNLDFHSQFSEGCRLSGHVDVSRVPGQLVFAAQPFSRRDHLNLVLTNTSHVIHHMHFSDPNSTASKEYLDANVPEEYRKFIHPIDHNEFIQHDFHHETHHFFQILATNLQTDDLTFYQMNHIWNPAAIDVGQQQFVFLEFLILFSYVTNFPSYQCSNLQFWFLIIYLSIN